MQEYWNLILNPVKNLLQDFNLKCASACMNSFEDEFGIIPYELLEVTSLCKQYMKNSQVIQLPITRYRAIAMKIK